MEKIKADYEVYTTTDYSIFKRLAGNRNIATSRINKIVNSIVEIGWIRNPIVINEKFEVIDGQGRLTALQKLGLPIEYIISEGSGTKECIKMNMDMTNWDITDFIKSYAELGNVSYQRLDDLMQNYARGSIHVIFTALFSITKPKYDFVRQGSMTITEEQYETAKAALTWLQPLYETLDTARLKGSAIKLYQTMLHYYLQDEVDKKRLYEKVIKYIYIANPWVTNVDCEKEIEHIYNYHTNIEDKRSIYYLLVDKRRRRRIELNELTSERAKLMNAMGGKGFQKIK